MYIQFFHEKGKKEGAILYLLLLTFPLLNCLKGFYLEADHEADQGQRNLNLSCTCMCNATAERLRAKLIRTFLS